MWIITILNFSTEISDTRPSRVIVVLYFSIEVSTEMLTCIIIILSFNTKISDIELRQVLVVLFLSTQINTEILT